ncbi:MAG: SDR family oxidoreductase [Thermoleophilaceae bacterium]|nr:SDR family oxidoreductase [Thermoleophilaceae bacterium]
MPQPLIAVTGATGAVGGLTAERLADGGANLRLIVRDPDAAPKIAGVDVAIASDYSATDEMTEALKGVDTLFLVSGRESENRLEQHYSAIDAAAAADVSRVVYTSFCGAAPDAAFTLARDHYATEQAIVQSGMAFVFQRQNLYTDFLPMLAGADGIIRGPGGDGRLVPVTRSDVADVAVRLLTDDSYDGETFNICGPERVSLRHIANRLTALTGKLFEYQQESVEDAYKSRSHYGAPDWQVEAWVSTYLAIADGEFDVYTESTELLSGHPPTSFERWVTDHPESWSHVERSA